MNKTFITLPNLLMYGSIVSPESGVLIQNIHTVSYRGGGEWVIGGEVITAPNGYAAPLVHKTKYTTITLVED
jgi:hypothetical protein